ncbi:MAG: substrate-binding domain-containing protein [Mobilitalea sp.]
MKSNKRMIDIAVITLAFLLFIIWHRYSVENAVQTTVSNIKNNKVYLITTDWGYEFYDNMNKGAADMADFAGIEYVWDAPAVRNTGQQIEIINKAVTNGADALLVSADDPMGVSGAIENAKARGVKIIYVDSPAYEEAITTLATDNYKAGVVAGQTMISILDEMEIDSGSIGIINVAAKENTKLRETGFRDTLAQDGRFNVLETIYMEAAAIPEDTQIAAQRMMNENEDLVALFGASERTSIGIGNAIKANDNKYVGVGFDKTQVMTQLLQDGNLQAIIDQNPYTMGYLGMAEAIAAILGKNTGPKFINTGVTVEKRR